MALTAIIVKALTRTPPKGFVKPDQSSQGLAGGRLVDLAFNLDQMALVLDAMLIEQPSFKAEPTNSLIEDGANISDHVTLKPITLHIEGIVTDTPVDLRNVWKGYKAALGIGTTPSRDAHKLLYRLWQERVPFDYVGGLQVYTNMVLTDYTPMRNAKTGGTLQFAATMQQVQTVSTKTVQSLKPTAGRAKKKSDLGTQATSKANETQELGASRWGGTYNGVQPTAAVSGGSYYGPPAGQDLPIR